MKTPSRTATAKKTRATATANKTRAEQIRQFNLALSPLSKTPQVCCHLLFIVDAQGRIPFSPLQMQSTNSLPQSPSRSPLKGKAKVLVAKTVDEEPEAKAKPAPKKRGRPKKNATVDKENEPAGDDVPSKSTRSAKATPASKPSTKTKTKKGKAAAKEVADVPEVVEPEPEPTPVETAPEPVIEPPTLAAAEEMVVVDEPKATTPAEPIVADEREHDSFETIPLELADEPVSEQMEIDDPVPVDEPPTPEPVHSDSPAKPSSPAMSPAPKSPSPVRVAKKISSETQSSPIKPSSPVKQSSPAKPSSPVKAASPPPALPTRQVRSSWLSQALGTNTVPIAPLDRNRISAQFDPLRKSQMAGTSKRKSETEGDLVALDKDNKRPDKVARFNTAATDAVSGLPVSPKKNPQFGSRAPASATSLPQASVSTPASAATRLAATSVPQAQGRMSKLQELKERTAAAAAAKQQEKAAAAAAANIEESGSTANGGFLRGLGGFLGRSATTIEAERDRQAQEMAERELTRVLQELAEQDKKAEEERLAKEKAEAEAAAKAAAKQAVSEDVYDSEDYGNVAIVIEDESADEYEVNDSVTLPSLPAEDSELDEDEDDPMEGTATSALAAAGIQLKHSTTPTHTPPRAAPSRIAKAIASPSRIKAPAIIVSPPPKTKSKPAMPAPIRTNSRAVTPTMSRAVTPSSVFGDEADDEYDEPYKKSRTGQSSSRGSVLNSSMSSTTSVLTQAERMAGKVLGVKPTPSRVKSVQAAEAAARKEQQDKERRAKVREEVDRKKAEDKKRKEDAERAKAEEERQKRLADEEERRRQLANKEKIRKAKMEKAEQQKREREAEAQKKAEEEAAAAAAKRKAASTLNRSASSSNLTKSTASSLNKAAAVKTPAQMKRLAPTPNGKAKEPLHPSNSAANLKSGPSTFRVNEPEQSSTIKAVPNRPALGPPSRTSGLGGPSSSAAGPSRPSAVRTHATATQTLQQQRATLQAQLDQKALDMESENIVLPDIASEYSNSDDEDKETDFVRPAWAESPELKHALEMQAHVNPDELFGPIKPLSMEELFQARAGKFRARTSSANWSGADRLTEQEEREYARRMGFRPINAPRDGGA